MKKFILSLTAALCLTVMPSAASEADGASGDAVVLRLPSLELFSLDMPAAQALDRNALINNFLLQKSKFFSDSDMIQIRQSLADLDETTLLAVNTQKYQDPDTMIIISLFVGGLGVDRFMLGDTGLGIAKLLTCGGFGIWWLIDLFTIQDLTKEKNFAAFEKAVSDSQYLMPYSSLTM